MNHPNSKVAVVVIGRNEGERLEVCLSSVVGKSGLVVYVDSASSDTSVTVARMLPVEVVELDVGRPFTAARARNAGFARVLELMPEVCYVQFLDGDCQLDPHWIATGKIWLKSHPQTVAVCGRRRECFVEKSLYNRLCDIEWDTPLGAVKSFGGDVLIRAAAFIAAGGYNAALPAGEEPELCLRLRNAGGVIERIPVEMSRHDAAILSFRVWWKRMVRGGYGAGVVSGLWRKKVPQSDVPFRGLTRSAFIWTDIWLLVLLGCVSFGAAMGGAAGALFSLLFPFGLWVFQAIRSARFVWNRTSGRHAFMYGLFIMIGKWAQRVGLWLHFKDACMRRRPQLIEYKS